MKKTVEIENKSSVSVHELKAGHKMKIEVDRDGTPIEKRWRRRLKDGKIDGHIVLAKKKAVTKATKKEV